MSIHLSDQSEDLQALLPSLPYGRQSISNDDIEAVVQVLRSSYLTQGPVLPQFEKAVADHVGSIYAVAVNSATSALHIACLALGLGPGDRLWTSPNTFVASANCGLYCGAQIDFVDIDPDTGLMSVPSLAAKLQKASRQKALPKVLVPVHLAGSSCDMEAIHSLSKIYGFTIIEDASHAIGGRYKEQSVGSCYYSDITVFSFHPVKIITTGEGGMATTNDPLLAQRMTDLRSHGIVKDTSRFEQEPAGAWIYEQQSLGFNYRMTDLQAALGLSQLQRLEAVVAERQQLLANYEQLLQHLPLQMLKIKSDVASAGHLAVIRLEDPRAEFHRFIFNGLREAGIGVQVHYAPVHLQPYYLKLGFRKDDFPSAEAYALNAISLPLYPGLQSSDQERVVECLAFLLGKRH